MGILLAFAPFFVLAAMDRLWASTQGLVAGAATSAILMVRDPGKSQDSGDWDIPPVWRVGSLQRHEQSRPVSDGRSLARRRGSSRHRADHDCSSQAVHAAIRARTSLKGAVVESHVYQNELHDYCRVGRGGCAFAVPVGPAVIDRHRCNNSGARWRIQIYGMVSRKDLAPPVKVFG